MDSSDLYTLGEHITDAAYIHALTIPAIDLGQRVRNARKARRFDIAMLHMTRMYHLLRDADGTVAHTQIGAIIKQLEAEGNAICESECKPKLRAVK